MTMAESSQSSLLLLLLLGMTSALAPSSPPPASSPWMDTSLCPMTDSLMVCQLKKGMCSPINTIFSPPGGPVKAIATCANSTGAILGPQFFMSVGLTFLSGAPESLADKASSDPTTATAIRRCALNSTSLLNPDLLTLNRTAVSNSLSNAFISPELGAAVAEAVTTCPEPIDYKLSGFINCLKVACMNNVAVTPFMSKATSALTGAGAPAAAAAAVVAAKKPPAPKTAAPAFAYPGAGAAGAGGAFAYPGAGGAASAGAGGAAPAGAGGAFAYPGAGGAASAGAGGAFAYPGAGGATAGGAASAAGPASYMAGAFPFAGAGTGSGASAAGAFSYPGAGGAAGAAPPTAPKMT